MFQLDKSLEDWKGKLINSNTMTESDVDELESHLLDEIDELKGKNLTEEESFYVACSRIGSVNLLSSEFGKVNFNLIWLKKFLWLLSGYLLIDFFKNFTEVLSCFTTVVIYKSTIINIDGIGYLNLLLNVIFSVIVLCLLFLPRYLLISKLQSKFSYLYIHIKWLLLLIFSIFIFMNTLGFIMLRYPLLKVIDLAEYSSMIQGQTIFSMIWYIILCLLFIIMAFRNYRKANK